MSKEYRVTGYTTNKWGQPRLASQYYSTSIQAREYADELKADGFTDIDIEVWEDGPWVSDHIVQKHLRTIKVA